jgi:hypothetical protein
MNRLFLLPFLLLVGCGPSVQLYQAIGTTTATVTATTTLLQSNIITAADAKAVYTGSIAAEAAEKTWDTSPSTSTSTVVTQDLSTLLAFLQSLQSHSPAMAAKVRAAHPKLAPGKAGQLAPSDITDIITLVQLAISLEPTIATWINDMFSTTSVTEAQIQTAFTNLDAANAGLLAVINAPTTQPATQP